MKVQFWGVRGSIPTPLTSEQIREKIEYILEKASHEDISTEEKRHSFLNRFEITETGFTGGNTACVEVRPSIPENRVIILDMGSGIKKLGNLFAREAKDEKKLDIHIFLSHTHWDHIHGFPFFIPAYLPQNHITIYSPHPNLYERLSVQQDPRFFPVSLEQMAAEKSFVQLTPNSFITLGNLKISNLLLSHPGDSFGYKIEDGRSSLVYATDSEFKSLHRSDVKDYVGFIQDADLLIFDSQYTFEEAFHKYDWGHSSAIAGIDLAMRGNVKRLMFFHHEPEYSDFQLQDMLKKARNYHRINYPESTMDIFIACEGNSLNL